jgi:hypothetical protein
MGEWGLSKVLSEPNRRHLGEVSRLAAATGAYVCFEDEAVQALRPPKARTWALLRPYSCGHRARQEARGVRLGGRTSLPHVRRAGPRVLPDVRPPRREGRAPQHVPSPITPA